MGYVQIQPNGTSAPLSRRAQSTPPLADRIVTAIDDLTRRDGRPPTYRELADAVHITSLGHLVYYLDRLRDTGRIQRLNGARGLVVTSVAESGRVAS